MMRLTFWTAQFSLTTIAAGLSLTGCSDNGVPVAEMAHGGGSLSAAGEDSASGASMSGGSNTSGGAQSSDGGMTSGGSGASAGASGACPLCEPPEDDCFPSGPCDCETGVDNPSGFPPDSAAPALPDWYCASDYAEVSCDKLLEIYEIGLSSARSCTVWQTPDPCTHTIERSPELCACPAYIDETAPTYEIAVLKTVRAEYLNRCEETPHPPCAPCRPATGGECATEPSDGGECVVVY